MRDVSRTFALSTETSRRVRARAISNARRAMRSTSRGWYSQDRAVLAGAARAEVDAADELPHDQQVDAALGGRPEVRIDVELGPQPHQALLRPDRSAIEVGMMT